MQKILKLELPLPTVYVDGLGENSHGQKFGKFRKRTESIYEYLEN